MTEVADSHGSRDTPMEQTTDQATTSDRPSAPVDAPEAAKMVSDSAPADGAEDDTMLDAPAEPDPDGDSEAETLIQSPEKQRTAADNTSAVGSASATRTKDGDSTADATATENDTNSRKRKRSVDDELTSGSSRRSSPLSSPRSSSRVPPHWLEIDSDASISKYISTNPPWRQRGSDAPESDNPESKPVKNATRKRRPSDVLPPISKHRTKNGGGGMDPGSTERRETRSATYPRHHSEDRSPSPRPQRREHRRGVSTQLTLGDVERKKRGRPPAIQTRRGGSAEIDHVQSDSSDDSGSPQQNQSSHKFSSADHDTMSPAKVTTGPRKWRDKNGRTFLSRAASNNDVAAARVKFSERPEDLNVPDNAGNTPLQIAALQGYVDIVKFLLENGCDVNTRNIDRDTALIDAVENGHVEVVKLLLDHGANPRLGNRKGDEPYELVPQDDENYQEIRKLLADAKEKTTTRRVSVEQTGETSRDGASSRAASAASPRDSPPMMGPRSPPAGFGRRRTGRSESTRNDLLWQANTQENLKKLASQGDVQGVANILNVLQKAETESLIAAAKAGHEEVLQYLLAMGNTEPDPDPIRHLKMGYNTPLLAAIGRGHPEVVKLLVEQSGFNPMKKLLKGKAYFEISAERRGEQWQKEYDILKTAYDRYAGKHRKAASPRTTRDSEKLKARANRRSQSPISSKLRNSSSPTLTHKQLPGKSPRSSHQEKDRDSGSIDGSERRKVHVPKRDLADLSVAVASDQDQTVNAPRKGHAKRRSQSDFSQQSNLDTEVTHRRRRLVTGKEHRRRKSNVDGSSDDDMVSVKAEGRPGTALKRLRDSRSPPQEGPEEGENGRGTTKKRRTVIESSPEDTRPGLRKNSNLSSSPARERKAQQEEAIPKGEKSKPDLSVQSEAMEGVIVDKPEGESQIQTTEASTVSVPANDVPLQRTETAEEIKTEPTDTGPSEAELQLQKEREEQAAEEARRAEEAKRVEQERIATEKAAEEQRLLEEAERMRKAEEEAALRKKEEEERQERLKREFEERQRRHEEQLKEQQRRQEELLREQQRRERLEAEQRRRDALPALLRHCALLIDNNDPEARSKAWLELFLPLFTVRSIQLDPNNPAANQNDLWIPNFQVAGLLATKDLNLRNYTSLETRPVTPHHRRRLWGVARNKLSYEFQTNQWNTTIKQANQREQEERPKFYVMEELFWVKLSDFQDQIFRHPHLANLSLTQQPISLRVHPNREKNEDWGSPRSTASLPDLANGKSPQLTNGVSSHSSPFATANGTENGYPRRED